MAANMPNKRTNAFNIILALMIIALAMWGLYRAYLYSVTIFSGLSKEILAPIIAGGFALIASFITVYVGKYFERKSSIEQEQRQKKAPIYQELASFILKMNPSGTDKAMSQTEQIEFMKKFTEMIIIWGSNEVISEWSNFRKQLINPDPSINPLFILERVLLAIRKDMGHKHSGFKQGDILRLFINDIDDYLKKSAN